MQGGRVELQMASGMKVVPLLLVLHQGKHRNQPEGGQLNA